MELVGANVDMIGTPEVTRLIDSWGKERVQGMTRSSGGFRNCGARGRSHMRGSYLKMFC